MEIIIQNCIFLLFICCSFVNLQESSNVFPLCSRRYPDIGECILKALNKLRPNLASGRLAPDFIIEPLDPFVLPHYEFGRGILTVKFSDINIIGATGFKIKGLRAYFEGDYLKFMPHIEYDRLDVTARYSLDGLLPLPQTGEFSFSLLDASIHGNGSVHIYKRDGIEYFKIEQAKLKFDRLKVGNVKFSLPVGPSIETGATINSLLNIFDGILLKFLYKVFEARIDEIHLDVANDFIKNVPLSKFFSE